MIQRAAGVMLIAKDGRALMMRRQGASHAGTWAFPGGGIEDGETAEQAARRELREETGYDHTGPLREWTRRIQDDVEFTTFIGEVDAQFAPILNDEHDIYTWASRDSAKDLPLHPGIGIALMRFELDELGVAKAIREGELASPVRFANMLLVALRITGTGASYRMGIDEYVWRDPSIYLNDHFLQRCNGLPVILNHPPGNMLNTQEYRDRVIGAIMLAYVQGDDVWGIARINDDEAATALETRTISTSPAVVFLAGDSNSKYRMEDGSTLLIEGKPSLLDHLALVPLGVWDKGGAPTGVQNQPLMETTIMADDVTDTKGDAAPAANAKSGDKLDTVLAHLDSLHTKMDSMNARQDAFEKDCKADRARMDAMEGAMGDKKGRKDAAETEDDDKDEPKMKAADKARKDAEEAKAKADAAEDEEKAKADAARADAQTALQKRLDELEAKIPRALTPEDRQLFAAAQEKAEKVLQAFGDAQASMRLTGESLVDYRKRMVGKLKQHSKTWAGIDVMDLNDQTLEVVEAQVYADALQAALQPDVVPAGQLRMIETKDDTGRIVRKFVGDPDVAFGRWKQRPRMVTGWNPKAHTVN